MKVANILKYIYVYIERCVCICLNVLTYWAKIWPPAACGAASLAALYHPSICGQFTDALLV